MQPGESITPTSTPPTDNQPEASQEQTTVDAIPATWQFNQENTSIAEPATITQAPVNWTASEYIAHSKTTAWFLGLFAAMVVIATVAYFVTKDFITTGAVAIAITTFGVFAGRAPRVLEYKVNSHGITIGTKFYPFGDFKSFDLSEESSLPAIQLMPVKRFMPPLTVFYDPTQEAAILAIVGDQVPHQEKPDDMIDRLTRKIRF